MNMHNTSFFKLLIVIVVMFSGCAKQVPKENLSLTNLGEKSFVLVKNKKYAEASEYLETLVTKYPEHAYIATYKVLLADIYFRAKEYAMAQGMYEHFIEFYPSNMYAEYARYKSILSMFNQTNKIDRDQTETKQTIVLCENYLKNHEHTKYTEKVITIKNECNKKLFDNELCVFNFYIHHGLYAAAEQRLKNIKEKKNSMTGLLIEPQILYAECVLAKKQKKMLHFQDHLALLEKKYPESVFCNNAQMLTIKNKFIF